MNIDYNKFFIMFCFGLPGSGKTNLLRYILYSGSKKNKFFDHCQLYSSTKNSTDYTFLDEKFKFDSYDHNSVDNYVNFCKKHNEKKIKTRGLLIFDDICGEQTFRSSLFKSLFSNYRHYGLSVIICQQMIVEIPRSIRSLISYACIFRYVNFEDKEKIYNMVGTLCSSKKDFYDKYENYTNEKYKFMFFSQKDVYNINNAYCGCRAPKIGKFKFIIK